MTDGEKKAFYHGFVAAIAFVGVRGNEETLKVAEKMEAVWNTEQTEAHAQEWAELMRKEGIL